MTPSCAQKVLLIGWDAADWKVITPLMDQGLLPTLNQFVAEGVMGNLATLRPIYSPMLWNSIVTGKTADKHGILGFTEPDPQTGGIRPVSSTSRKVKALWNILTQRGYRAHVVGWFAGHPAEPISGVAVSPLFPLATAPPGEPWPLPDDCIHPARLRDTLAALRVHPAEMTGDDLLPFVPRAAGVNQEKDRRLAVLARILAETCSIHNAATWILQNEPWDFLAVYYNGIDHFSHAFMPFHPPRMEQVSEPQFEMYREVIDGAYRFHDMMLSMLLALVGPDTTVLLLSDHGFHSDHLRPRGIPKQPAGPAIWHRQQGIFAIKGPRIRRDERIYGATLLDVTPTVLTLFGLPVGADMDGRVLAQAFAEPVQPETIPGWEDEPGECGMHPADLYLDPAAAQAIIAQFVALGYIEAPGEDTAKALQTSVRESRFNLAQVYLDTRRPRQALPLLEELVRQQPDTFRFEIQLAQCYLALGRRAMATGLLESLRRRGHKQPVSDWLMGIIRYEEGDYAAAVDCLHRAEQADPRLPDLHLRIGNAYLRLRRWDDAERAFGKALAIDGDSPQAHLGLALTHQRRRRSRQAAEHALAAVSLQHFLPEGHFQLGVALTSLQHYKRAVLAFEMALGMAPGMRRAHRWLSTLHSRPGGDPVKALHHKLCADRLRRQRRRAETP